MNWIKKYGYIFLVFTLMSSCAKDDWFNVKTRMSITVPSTIEDLQQLLDNAQVFNGWCPKMGENASDYHYYASNIIGRVSGMERNSYTWSKDFVNRNVTDWVNGRNGSYGKIYTANLILELVEELPLEGTTNVTKDNVKGQALFYRGKTFFELAEIFVPPYSTTNKQLKLGIPLRLGSDISVPSFRSTIEETYDQIFEDLLASVKYLPANQDYLTRPSKIAAYAMLARIYLAISDFDNALKYANLVLSIKNKVTDYKSLDLSGALNPFLGYTDEMIHYSYINGSIFVPSSVNIDPSFYNSYSNSDLRKVAYFNYNALNGLIGYKGTYAGRGFDNFFSGLAVDEIYLIRAECYARKGDVALAMKDLNYLLRNRFVGPYSDLTARNAEEALIMVIDERKKELVLRGVRWSDLRRLNNDSRFARSFSRTVDGKTYTLEPNSYKYTFPLPDDVIQITGMQQNPGW